VSLAFLDLIDLEPTLQATFGWCAVVGLLCLLLARWKWWSALATVPFAIFCSMHWEFQALGRDVFTRRAVGSDALLTYLAEGMVILLIGAGIVWNRLSAHDPRAASPASPNGGIRVTAEQA
jgi:hypothetical protein